MGARKRTRSEAVAAPVAAPMEQKAEEPGLLQQIRSSWEFASLMQYIALFGRVMKIDEDFEIEDLEDECLKPEPSHRLLEIGLCLLKWISSHRGLTHENFDEYTRRQYNAKAPHITNPFGYDEEPLKFLQFDVFTKLRVLHQLSVWTFWNTDRIRDKMPEKKEGEQLQWRIEEFGYDQEGRSYYVLDDNRLYRRTDPPIPAPQRPKKKPKSRSSRTSRTSRRVSALAAEEASDNESKADAANGTAPENQYKWECVAVTLSEYQAFLDTIRKSKDPDEKFLRDRIEEHVMPLLEKAEEAQQRKIIKREKELINLQMLAGAKRSSRLAQKEERERAEKEAAEAARKHEADLAEARREQAKQKQLEQERQSRMMTREQRTRDREQKRLLHQEELDRIAAEQERLERGEGRISARNLKAELEKSQKNLNQLTQEDDEWVFDCAGCGAYGENLDDGSHSVACEKCNVWQHSKCLGISMEDAEKDDFHFVCRDCKRKEEEANKPKIPPLKFRVSSSASPQSTPPTAKKQKMGEKEIAPPSPVKQTHAALSSMQNAPPRPPTEQPTAVAAPATHPSLPSLTSPGQFYPPPSPQRRPHHTIQTPLPSSSPPRPPFSPPKNGMNHNQPQYDHDFKPFQHIPGPQVHQLPPMHLPSLPSMNPVRPYSSHSGRTPTQTQPSMSPTQGNHEVGPLAGLPYASTAANGSAYQSFDSYNPYTTPRPQSGHGAPPSMSGKIPSFSASATPNGNHSSPPHSSHGMGMSGISPTKQSPRPMTSGSGMAGAPVLPPIRRLEPSPKLMGRSSPDAPIPPPVKCMTPEQEERRARENASLFNPGHGYPAHGQAHPMSSPSFNRIPPLGPAATNQYPEPVPSPQRGGDAPRQ